MKKPDRAGAVPRARGVVSGQLGHGREAVTTRGAGRAPPRHRLQAIISGRSNLMQNAGDARFPVHGFPVPAAPREVLRYGAILHEIDGSERVGVSRREAQVSAAID